MLVVGGTSLGTPSPTSLAHSRALPSTGSGQLLSPSLSLVNPHPPGGGVLPNVQIRKGQSAYFCLFLPDVLSAAAEKGFGAVVFVTTLPMQLGAVEYNMAGTSAAFNTALLD